MSTLDAQAQASIKALSDFASKVKARNAKAAVAPSSSKSAVTEALKRKHGLSEDDGDGADPSDIIRERLAKMSPAKRRAFEKLAARKKAGEKVTVDDLVDQGLVDQDKAEVLRAKVRRTDEQKKLPAPAVVPPELRAELKSIADELRELRAAVVESDARSVAAIETANSASQAALEQSQHFAELLQAVAVSTQMQREIMKTLSAFEGSGLLAAARTSDDPAAAETTDTPENGVSHDGE